MGDLQLSNSALHTELRAIDDSHTAQAGKYLDWIEERDLDLVSGLLPYVESLKQGYIGRDGETHTFKASGWNARVSAATNRIMYAFDRSPDAADLTKRAQLLAYTSLAPRKKIQRAPVRRDKYLPWGEVETVIARLPEVDPQIAPLFEFLARTGVRIVEALGSKKFTGIRLNDIKMNGIAVITIHGKGGKDRDVVIDATFLQSVIDFYGGSTWLFEHHGKPYNKRSTSNRISAATAKILGHSISSHGLRHSYARHAIVDLKLSVKAVANQLGHSSTAITMDFYVDDEPSGDLIALMAGPTEDELAAQASKLAEEMAELSE